MAEGDRRRGLSSSGEWRIAALSTLAFFLVLALLAGTASVPPAIVRSVAAVLLLSVVITAAVRWGVRAGLVSAAIAVFAYAYFASAPGQPFSFTARGLRALVVVGIALPVVGLVTGLLSERLRRALARERQRQHELEETAAELEVTVDELRARTLEAEAAQDKLAEAARRSKFLAEASRVLARSLDYERTLQTVAHLVVSTLADWCIIDVVEVDGSVRRLATAHRDPAKKELVDQLVRFPPDSGKASGVPAVLRNERSSFDPVIPEDRFEAIAQSADHLKLIRALQPRSGMIVPLITRDRTLGAITFAMSESGRRYTRDDLALAEDLAGRAALAMDNARLYGEAAKANRAKSDFLAVMSHELRTPLNAILGYTDLLAAEMMGPLTDEQQAKLERLKANAQHLLELIEEILGFAGVQAGSGGITIERLDLRDLVRPALPTIEPMARDKKLRFMADLPDSPTPVETDPDKVRQILVHLLSNAVKFTEHGEVRLAAWVEDDRIILRVRDTGVGIAPAALDRIFDSFWQVERVATRSAGGTGLGLSVARQLARLLGGDITVASTVGGGSTFTVDLPARRRGREDAQDRIAADGVGLF